jgi:hypothetical protein
LLLGAGDCIVVLDDGESGYKELVTLFASEEDESNIYIKETTAKTAQKANKYTQNHLRDSDCAPQFVHVLPCGAEVHRTESGVGRSGGHSCDQKLCTPQQHVTGADIAFEFRT